MGTRLLVDDHQSRYAPRQSARCHLARWRSAQLRATTARAGNLAQGGPREPADPPRRRRAGLRGRAAARLRPRRAGGLCPLRATATRLRSGRVPGLWRPAPGRVQLSVALLSVVHGSSDAATTLNLLAHVAPSVGLRQLVFTVPAAGPGLASEFALDRPPGTPPQPRSRGRCSAQHPRRAFVPIAAQNGRARVAHRGR